MASHRKLDLFGTNLSDEGAALAEAESRAVEALRDGFARGEDRRDWVIVVRDDRGAALTRLTLGEAAGSSLGKVLT